MARRAPARRQVDIARAIALFDGPPGAAQWRHTHRIRAGRFGPDHYEVAVCLHGLGVVEHRRGDPREARRLLTEALRISTAVLGADHLELAALRHNLAAALPA